MMEMMREFSITVVASHDDHARGGYEEKSGRRKVPMIVREIDEETGDIVPASWIKQRIHNEFTALILAAGRASG
jgi:hypothetical protein